MKFPVEVTITNKRFDYRDLHSADDVPEPRIDTSHCTGYMQIKGKKIELHYIDILDEIGLFPKSVFVNDDVVVMANLWGATGSFVLRTGQSCECIFDDGFFTLPLRISTGSLESDLCKLGGKLKVDYTVELMGRLAEKNTMCLSVYPIGGAS